MNEIGTKMKPIEESSCCSQYIEIIGLYYNVSIFQALGIVSSQRQLSKSIQSGSLYISYILWVLSISNRFPSYLFKHYVKKNIIKMAHSKEHLKWRASSIEFFGTIFRKTEFFFEKHQEQTKNRICITTKMLHIVDVEKKLLRASAMTNKFMDCGRRNFLVSNYRI